MTKSIAHRAGSAATVLLCLCLGGCGGAGGSQATSLSARARLERSFKGDEDDDESTTITTHAFDSDNDQDNDSNESHLGYHDSDDNTIEDYGHLASGTEARALTSVVERYYAAAHNEDGATACTLIRPSFARSIPEDYGAGAGPSYLRGRTCGAVMTLLFKHLGNQLKGAVSVTGVRVHGDQAYVLVGSSTARAGYLTLEREAGSWVIVGLIAEALP